MNWHNKMWRKSFRLFTKCSDVMFELKLELLLVVVWCCCCSWCYCRCCMLKAVYRSSVLISPICVLIYTTVKSSGKIDSLSTARSVQHFWHSIFGATIFPSGKAVSLILSRFVSHIWWHNGWKNGWDGCVCALCALCICREWKYDACVLNSFN